MPASSSSYTAQWDGLLPGRSPSWNGTSCVKYKWIIDTIVKAVESKQKIKNKLDTSALATTLRDHKVKLETDVTGLAKHTNIFQ